MEKIIKEILLEESKRTGIAEDRLEFLANYGCKIAFQDDLKTRVGLFGGSDFFTKETLKELILTLIDGADARLEAEFLIDNNTDNDRDWEDIEAYFLNDFYKLPVVYENNGFKIRDVNKLDRDKEYIDLFFQNYLSSFTDFYNNVFFDDSVVNKIEIECYALNFLSYDEIVALIKEKFISSESDDNELYEDDFFVKYKKEAKKILDDMGRIMQIIWDSVFYLQQDFYYLSKSLFISMYHLDYILPYEDWKEIEKIVNN